MLDLQTCKSIDIVEKTIMTPWICHGLSYDNQIWCRDSFWEGTAVCKISLSCVTSNVVLHLGKAQLFVKFHCPASPVTLFSKDGEVIKSHCSPVIESQKSQLEL